MSTAPSPNRSESEFSEVEIYASQAIDLAIRYGTPPVPRNYEVWYTYAAGENEQLTQQLERVMTEGQRIETWWLEQLYNDFLSPRGLNDGVAKISRRMDNEIGGLLGSLQKGMQSNQRAAQAMQKIGTKVESVTTPAALADAARKIAAIGEEQVSETRRLGETLHDARAELAGLQAELEELRSQAFVDHLTQLPNRRRLEQELNRAIESASANGEPMCFALADIDRFKRLNDTWGHAVGDLVLVKFARIIKDILKGRDTPARFGGEEFAIVLPETALDNARVVIEKIRTTFGQRWFVVEETGAEVGHVTASFGLTRLRKGDTMQSLIERADGYLYEAKNNGRDQVWSAE